MVTTVGSDGLEEDALHLAFALAEGHLGAPLGQLVDHDRPVGALWHHRGEVVSSGVPCHLGKESIKYWIVIDGSRTRLQTIS